MEANVSIHAIYIFVILYVYDTYCYHLAVRILSSRDPTQLTEFSEIRTSLKIQYADLHIHAARLYLWGCNTPVRALGNQ
jgi:hypothetical protein